MGIVANLWFERVFFHNAISTFQTEKSHDLLKYLGLNWISYKDVPFEVWCKSFQLNADLGKQGVQNILKKSYVYSFFIEYFHLDNLGVKKLEASLQRNLTSRWIHEGTSSFVLIEHLFDIRTTKVSYMPSSVNNLLAAYSLEQKNLMVVSVHCILLELLQTILVLKRLVLSTCSLRKIFKMQLNTKSNGAQCDQTTSDFNIEDCTIAFFPHQNLRYGSFFNKTYLYENDSNSLFYKKKILTIFDENTDPVSQRFLRFHGIPNTFLNTQSSIKDFLGIVYEVWKTIGLLKFFGDLASFKKSIGNFMMLRFLVNVELNYRRLKNFHALKLAYFHYDILVSNALLLACHIKSITTVSMLERTISSIWETGLIFDHYFIAGEGFKEILKKRGYCIQKYHVVGMPRKTYISEPKAKWKYQKFIDIKSKGLKLVVCFDFPPLNNFLSGLQSEIISENCIREFYLSIIQLAEEFPTLYFVVKPKVKNTFTNLFDEKMRAKVDLLNNFEVITDLKKYNPYVMAYYADLIIGKHTSVMEEAFSAGKKIFFYDSEKYLQSSTHVVNNIDIVVDNYVDLKKKVTGFINNDQYLESNEWTTFNEHYFQEESQQNGFVIIKQKLTEIHTGLTKV